MRELVEEICRAKREQGIVPVLATERELKHLLSCRGVKWTAETFKKMCEELEAEPDIICRRLLRYNGYQLKEDYEDECKECCEICGRVVEDGDYITSHEGDIICKCCGFDALEDSYFALMNVVRHLRNTLEAAAPAMLAMENALEVLPDEVLEQIKAYNDADNTEAQA